MREGCKRVLLSQQIAGDVARNGGEAAQRRLLHVTWLGVGKAIALQARGKKGWRLEKGERKVRQKRASRPWSYTVRDIFSRQEL